MLTKLLALVALAAPLLLVSATPDVYVNTPQGRVRSDCVHRVGSGSTLRTDVETGRLHHYDAAGVFVRAIPLCENQKERPLFEHTLRARQGLAQAAKHKIRLSATGADSLIKDDPLPADYDGWEAYTAYNLAAGFNSFLGNFSVPDTPANPPDQLFIFTGLQNVDWIPIHDPEVPVFDIIQPVLQYPADGGYWWSVKSWYVTTDEGAIQSDEVALAVGDAVFGNMTQTGATSWFIGSTSVATGQSTTITVDKPRLALQPWAYNTLECYGCVDCTTYPTLPSKFTNLILQSNGVDVSADWLLNPKPNAHLKCKETIDIISEEEQNIVFQ